MPPEAKVLANLGPALVTGDRRFKGRSPLAVEGSKRLHWRQLSGRPSPPLAWGGQTLAWLAPSVAARWGLTEAQEDVEPVYHADIRGEALFDALTLWTMVAAGLLLLVGSGAWPYFGLVGGGIYVYFAGRGVSTRLEMQRLGFRIGSAANVRVAYVFLTLWGIIAVVTIVLAAIELSSN